MESSTDIWNTFLHATNRDESKKETNLIVLGNSINCCLTLIDGILESLNLPLLKNRNLDLLYYTYATIGYPNKKNTNGDYLGIVHIHCMTDTMQKEFLSSSSQNISLENTMFVIVVDFKDICNIMNCVEKWLGFIDDYCTSVVKEKDQLIRMKEKWAQRVLSFVQHYQQSILQQDELDASSNPIFPQHLLNVNMGVPICVVCTNTEVITQSKELGDGKLDFIQKFLRSCCLEHGASLSYLNTMKRSSIQSITSYMLSVLYPSHYSLPPPSLNSKDEVFIPVGYDNMFTIQDILGTTKLASITDFNAVIERPPQSVKKAGVQQQVLQSEEEFFSTLINQEASSPTQKKSRKSMAPRDPSGKSRLSIQQQALSPPSKQSGESSTPRDFFENLITQNAGPRKSVSVRNLRRSEAVSKNAPSHKM